MVPNFTPWLHISDFSAQKAHLKKINIYRV